MGAALIWAGYNFNDFPIVAVLEEVVEEVSYAGIALMVAGGVMIVGAFFGFLGALKRNCCCLTIFMVISILVAVLLLIIGAGLLYAATFIEDELASQEKCESEFSAVDEGLKEAAALICTQNCPCDIEGSTAEYNLTSDQDAVFDGSATKIDECDPCSQVDQLTTSQKSELDSFLNQYFPDENYSSTNCNLESDELVDGYFEDTKQFLPFFEWLEEEFECSGLCSVQQFYFFSDINNGPPEDNCRDALIDWIDENFTIYGACLITVGAYLVRIT